MTGPGDVVRGRFTRRRFLHVAGLAGRAGTRAARVLATDVVLPGTSTVHDSTLTAAEVGRLVHYILDSPAD